jgi:CheY-like chemotaxis protein
MAKTVLFVDDNEQLLDVYRLQLDAEYTVVTAESGEEALEMFSERIDFAFFDRRMPGMSGDETIRKLRERGYQTPVGVISAVEAETDSSIPCVAYLVKPVSEDDISAVIREALR